MEYLRVTEGKLSPKRELRSSRTRNQRSNLIKNNIMDSINAQINGGGSHLLSQRNEDGVVRMKLLVRKEDLKQMLEMVRGGRSNNINGGSYQQLPSSFSLEHRLQQLRKRQMLRANATAKDRSRSSWSPVLQSIPEEISA